MNKRLRRKLLTIYNKLYKEFGPRHWWPADTPFEVIVGAILTQNTAWNNVERAIANLKERRLLNIHSLAKLKNKDLARLIHSTGYYNIKAKRLKNFLNFLLHQFGGNLKEFFNLATKELRTKLLSIDGIGDETADSILLYAAKRPVFVVDSYTKRILSRHNIVKPNQGYKDIQSLFMENLPKHSKLFNEYHALIVQLGKLYCKNRPLCHLCPLYRLQ